MAIQDGKILLTGRFKYDFDAQAMGGNYILEYVYAWDIFLVCLNIDGSFNWAGQVGDENSDIGYAVDFDNEGNIYQIKTTHSDGAYGIDVGDFQRAGLRMG